MVAKIISIIYNINKTNKGDAMNNLKSLRNQKRLSQSEMAKYLCVSQGTYSLWENDKVKIDNESLQNLADFFGVTVDYILGREESRPPQRGKGKWIPVYGEIAAGIPIEAIENIIDYEEISNEMAATGEFIALRIKGDSMEPRIKEGDVVIIRRQVTIENGEIAAVMVNGDSATLKYIIREDNGLWLISSNQAYPPVFYTRKECEQLPITILGRLVELRAKF